MKRNREKKTQAWG